MSDERKRLEEDLKRKIHAEESGQRGGVSSYRQRELEVQRDQAELDLEEHDARCPTCGQYRLDGNTHHDQVNEDMKTLKHRGCGGHPTHRCSGGGCDRLRCSKCQTAVPHNTTQWDAG